MLLDKGKQNKNWIWTINDKTIGYGRHLTITEMPLTIHETRLQTQHAIRAQDIDNIVPKLGITGAVTETAVAT